MMLLLVSGNFTDENVHLLIASLHLDLLCLKIRLKNKQNNRYCYSEFCTNKNIALLNQKLNHSFIIINFDLIQNIFGTIWHMDVL